FSAPPGSHRALVGGLPDRGLRSAPRPRRAAPRPRLSGPGSSLPAAAAPHLTLRAAATPTSGWAGDGSRPSAPSRRSRIRAPPLPGDFLTSVKAFNRLVCFLLRVD